ncbi:pyruvoyl-dependent arginine decarboxylase subunit alpha [Halarchaeum sp. CBA1220]|uniref:pyruvoyl-dependent arginine decarboxylase n=1 Tax=Halarchaeum sp. CBA1220 TaxID=1853682 RepID=UPI000F3AA09B|nr:pyruvoyl-dependent arginine decarboxylase [Halarchaeum sp. CBA1220]QLC33103.1 pyruvoyl-dependent arginine decarboxylase subunit alpha [Halarchaeum sp. CBA1220]
MNTINVVWGTGTGPTAMSAYDAALADANVHNYNLVTVSSVIPAAADVEAVGTAPDLGPAGERLTVVEAHANAAGPRHLSAGLGWTKAPEGPGLFYEVADETDAEDVAARVRAGLDAGRELRDWAFAGERVETTTVEADPGEYASAVVVACYGESEPIL